MHYEMSLEEYRAIQKQPRTSSEHDEQVALMRWASLYRSRVPELGLLYAVPNGGHRHPTVAAKLQSEGVRAGVPDLCLPVARRQYHGMYIELKAGSGRPTQEQLHWLEALRQQGYWADVCVGWQAAARDICHYLGVHPMELGL